ncbi:MAG: hypothetical protein FWE18_00230 [Alphaproteobacteria bacterium]|nr:hypothetical protein [Alphaproteobacteria bacterium]
MPTINQLINKLPQDDDYILIGNGALQIRDISKLMNPQPDFSIIALIDERKLFTKNNFYYILLDGTDYRDTEYAKIHDYFKNIVRLRIQSDLGGPFPRLQGGIFTYKTTPGVWDPDWLGRVVVDGESNENTKQYYIEFDNNDGTLNLVRMESGIYTMPVDPNLDTTDAVGRLIQIDVRGQVVGFLDTKDITIPATGVVQSVDTSHPPYTTMRVKIEMIQPSKLEWLAKYGSDIDYQTGDIPDLTAKNYMIKVNTDVTNRSESSAFDINHSHSLPISLGPTSGSYVVRWNSASSSGWDRISSPFFGNRPFETNQNFNISINNINYTGASDIIPTSRNINWYCKMRIGAQ